MGFGKGVLHKECTSTFYERKRSHMWCDQANQSEVGNIDFEI